MSLVTVTGNLFDHMGKVIPAGNRPELWFRPERSHVVGPDALVGVEARATLNATTGAFSVKLVAFPGIRYRMFARWLVDASATSPEAWAWQYAEWPRWIDPYPIGGKLTDLVQPDRHPLIVRVSLAHPEDTYRGLWLHSAPGDEDNPESSGSGMLRMVIDA